MGHKKRQNENRMKDRTGELWADWNYLSRKYNLLFVLSSEKEFSDMMSHKVISFEGDQLQHYTAYEKDECWESSNMMSLISDGTSLNKEK